LGKFEFVIRILARFTVTSNSWPRSWKVRVRNFSYIIAKIKYFLQLGYFLRNALVFFPAQFYRDMIIVAKLRCEQNSSTVEKKWKEGICDALAAILNSGLSMAMNLSTATWRVIMHGALFPLCCYYIPTILLLYSHYIATILQLYSHYIATI